MCVHQQQPRPPPPPPPPPPPAVSGWPLCAYSYVYCITTREVWLGWERKHNMESFAAYGWVTWGKEQHLPIGSIGNRKIFSPKLIVVTLFLRSIQGIMFCLYVCKMSVWLVGHSKVGSGCSGAVKATSAWGERGGRGNEDNINNNGVTGNEREVRSVAFAAAAAVGCRCEECRMHRRRQAPDPLQ